jgi:DNA-binding HxlR family transcriptional regulator
MGSFDELILTVLNDGKRRVFTQLLDEAGFSRNTLKLRLKRLAAQGLVMKEKIVSNGRGRPKYAISYHPRFGSRFRSLSQTRR